MNRWEWENTLEKNIQIVDYYGVKSQIPVWIEEMNELTKVLCKWSRNYDKLEGDINSQLLLDMKEEITDVTICLDQLKYVIELYEDELMKDYEHKVDRQLKRIQEDE